MSWDKGVCVCVWECVCMHVCLCVCLWGWQRVASLAFVMVPGKKKSKCYDKEAIPSVWGCSEGMAGSVSECVTTLWFSDSDYDITLWTFFSKSPSYRMSIPKSPLLLLLRPHPGWALHVLHIVLHITLSRVVAPPWGQCQHFTKDTSDSVVNFVLFSANIKKKKKSGLPF